MDIGTGIAIVGVWLFPSACVLSKSLSGTGLVLFAIIAFILTCVIL